MPQRPAAEVIVIDDDIATGAGPSNQGDVLTRPTAPRYIDLTSSPEVQRPHKRRRLSETVVSGLESLRNHGNDAEQTKIDDIRAEWPELLEDVMLSSPVPQVRNEPEPPYFVDAKLRVKMYRGPGYEVYPLPVDIDPEFKKFCQNWDEKMQQKIERKRRLQIRYNEFGSYVDDTIPAEETDDEEVSTSKEPTAAQRECLARILEVLPDVQHDFVLSKIVAQHEAWDFDGDAVEIVPDSNHIIEQILSLEAYPREPKDKGVEKCAFEAETGKTIKWDIANRGHKNYIKNAVAILASQFEHVPTHYIDRTVKQKKELWATFVHIQEAELSYFQVHRKPYYRSRQPRPALEKKYHTNDAVLESAHFNMLICELQAVKQHLMREHLKKDQKEAKTYAENQNLERHKEAGTIIECQCCFDDEIPINRAVTCMAASAEHSFCFNCVENLANTQVGLMRHQMLCMDGSGCKEKLDMEAVGRAIPLKTFDRLLFNEQQAEITAADLEGLEQCPSCDFKAICDPIEDNPVFHCQNPDCYKVTCRKCHEISHLPKTCEEVVKDRKLDAKHQVEEARSAAVMRPCPKCKSMIIKEMGCNKMRCTCGAIMCYYCKGDLSNMQDGYSHFSGRGSTGKCPLYDAQGVDRHAVEADEAEIRAIQEVKENNESIEEEDLRIETGKQKTATRPAPPRFPDQRNDIVDPVGVSLDAAMRHRFDRLEQELNRRVARRERRVPVNLPAIPPFQPIQPPRGQPENRIFDRPLHNLENVLPQPPRVQQWLNQIHNGAEDRLSARQNADMANEILQAARINNNFGAEIDRRRNNIARRPVPATMNQPQEFPQQGLQQHGNPGVAMNQPQELPQPAFQQHFNPGAVNVNVNLVNRPLVQLDPLQGPPANWRQHFRPPTPVPVRRLTAPLLGGNWGGDFNFDLDHEIAAEVRNAQQQPRQQQEPQPMNHIFGYNMAYFDDDDDDMGMDERRDRW